MPPGLRLPPGIDNGTALLPDVFVIPMPGFLIDRLPDGSQYLQTAQILVLYEIKSETHQTADSSGRGIDNIDLELVHDVPEATGIGLGRNAFEHEQRSPRR